MTFRKSPYLFSKVKYFAQFLGSLQNLRSDKVVFFLCGVQRSGTNMIMNILDRSWKTQVFHESDPRAYLDYEMRPDETIRRLFLGSPAKSVIFKPGRKHW